MNRKVGLDFLKFICSFMIICIHIPFPEPIGTIITPITRIAVPIFFMITGYFYSLTRETNGEIKQIKKIAKLFIGANFLYLMYALIKHLLNEETIIMFFREMFNLKNLLKFIVLNESPFGIHLWYLGAILYVLIILFLFEKKWNREKLYPLIPFLILMDLVLGKYSLLIFGKEFPYILVRNFLCVGLPYFLIGDIIYKINPKIKTRNLIILIFIFVFTTLLERSVLGSLGLNATRDHYLSTAFLSISVFLIAINCGNTIKNQVYQKCCFIGSRLTLHIYILHPIFIDVISKVIRIVSCNEFIKAIFDYACPFVVFIISIITSWMLYIGIERVKRVPYKSRHSN